MNSQINDQKRFFIKTLGCKVNQYESQAMREILLGSGFRECVARDIADVYILNTCTVTNRADKESRYWLGFFHKTNPKAKIVVTGCYVERDSGDISFLPGISHILKNDEKGRIAEILTNSNTQHAVRSTQYDSFSSLRITDFKDHTKAFVKIQDGCENNCSYCKVSLVRGHLRSRSITDISKEVEILVEKGFKEIVLTGVCLGAWGKDPYTKAIANIWPGSNKLLGLADVLKVLDKLSGDFRIRLSSIEPKYVTEDLLDYISNNRRICRHLHIPVQSGDDEVLRKMNRPYAVNYYRSLINKARSKIKDVAITTDILIGFPGESDVNFKNTVNFVKDVIPARTHIFTFSRRKGTSAYEMEGIAKKDILKGRYCELEAASLSASYIYRRRFLNEKLDVLAETKRDRHSGLLTGYTDNYIKVLFEGPDSLMNRIIPVKIEDLNLTYTYGSI